MNIGSHKASPVDQRSRPNGPLGSELNRDIISVVNKTAMIGSSPSGYEIPPSGAKSTDTAPKKIPVPSRTDKEVDLGQLFNEGYCIEPEMHDNCKPTEVVTNELDAGVNDQEENPDDEGWMGGMFDFSEEGRSTLLLLLLLLLPQCLNLYYFLTNLLLS